MNDVWGRESSVNTQEIDTTRRRKRRLLLVGGSTSCVALIAAASFLFLRNTDSGDIIAKPAPPTTTTTTTAPTTTAPPTTAPPATPAIQPRLKSPKTTIATIKPEFILVTKTVPADAATSPRIELDPGSAPPRLPSAQDAGDLPNPDYPIVGRQTYGDGWRFDNPGPFGEQLTLLVTAKQGKYLEVELPVRPNGTRGWIPAEWAELTTTNIHFEVILAEHRLLAWDGNTLLADVKVTIGTPDTRTPTGRHFITDRVKQSSGSKYGPWIFGLDAYSEDMSEFDGGAPQIAIHGWNDPSAFGRSISNGCVRIPNDVIERLSVVPLGAIVDVWAQ